MTVGNSQSASADGGADHEVHADQYRAGVYSVLGRCLAAPPSASLIAHLGQIPSVEADGPRAIRLAEALTRAWSGLRDAVAEHQDVGALDDEYHQLFIGIGRGELVPYASWYRTGFLMEQPLADLRTDLGRLGFERQDGIAEPEDHISALLEVMVFLIGDDSVSINAEKEFFETHISPWAGQFFVDLEKAKSAQFYRAVAGLGTAFTRVEQEAFAMVG